MGKLATWLPVYNENSINPLYGESAITRVLENTKSYGIDVYASDCRWTNFDDVTNISYDGTNEILKSYDHVKLFNEGNFIYPQWSVNTAFKLAAKDGFKLMMTMGCDEYVSGDLEQAISTIEIIHNRNKLISFGVKWIEENPNRRNRTDITHRVRIYADPMFVRTRFTHFRRFYCNREMGIDYYLDDEFSIHHDDAIRPDSRNTQMDKFQDKDSPMELEYSRLWVEYQKGLYNTIPKRYGAKK